MNARALLLAALPLTFAVVVAGAFVRLSDAGLGCPDWPGCYGKLVGIADAQTAAAHYPESDYDARKAWIEVGHRYIAGALGLLLLAAAALHWREGRRFGLPSLLVLLVLGQATLGMLTVTEKLKPVIVVAHLLGGMLILGFAAAAVARRPLSAAVATAAAARLRSWWWAAAAVLAVQIALGGWVSANYAGLACAPEFPLCQGGWLPPQMDFAGFQVQRELHSNPDGTPISAAALATIHWVHRAMAALLLAVFGALCVALWRQGARREARALAVFTLVQIALGVVNVLWQLPLWAAVLHNAVAALLVVKLAVLGVKLNSAAGAEVRAGGGVAYAGS